MKLFIQRGNKINITDFLLYHCIVDTKYTLIIDNLKTKGNRKKECVFEAELVSIFKILGYFFFFLNQTK